VRRDDLAVLRVQTMDAAVNEIVGDNDNDVRFVDDSEAGTREDCADEMLNGLLWFEQGECHLAHFHDLFAGNRQCAQRQLTAARFEFDQAQP
jgi:hypothetical protein